MEAIGCLVPELRSKRHHRCGMQVFEKMRCFYVVMVIKTVMSPYTIVLHKIDLCSCKKAARKSAKIVGKYSGGESRGLHCLYKQKDNHIQVGSL